MHTAFRLLVVAVLVLTVASAPAAAANATSPCFPGEGHQFDIGDEGTTIDLVVFLSIVENLGGPGGFGLEAAGGIGDQEIIQLRAGVVFDGVGPLTDFLSNPFSRFSVVYDFSLDFPMFSGSGIDSSYEDDGSPVKGVNTTEC
ncbi:DUF7332 family protein [Haloferax larsenii]|uniref:Uncharacterized protein n=1 Tax=Haloferax larsenii TaxID=302484 RepID=A0A1H7H7T5_HALLR|nr:hypothetical protein [Haloferax larsenii]SEK46354.1 hypothetical protein SAMN04488691_101512 [Haloferax larsenii]